MVGRHLPYSVELPNMDPISIGGQLLREVEKWCEENFAGDYQLVLAEWAPARHTIYFQLERDAVAFKLRWLG